MAGIRLQSDIEGQGCEIKKSGLTPDSGQKDKASPGGIPVSESGIVQETQSGLNALRRAQKL